ncbi:MAG: PAS domain-containing protein, partial [Acidaminobacteraceae bacterium]
MPSEKLLKGNNKYIEAWENFIVKDKIDSGVLRKKIVESWIRSKSYSVDPYDNSVEVELGAQELKKRSLAFKPILDIALPFMETIYKAVGESGMIVRFTDGDGYVLECFGDEFVINQNNDLHLYKGTNVSEEYIGTNAIGIALRKGIALQVLGAEHYRKGYHKWTSSAAPIKNDDGEIIGVLSMSGSYKRVHPHTLGMILASALAIEHEINLNKSNDDLTRANKHLDAIMQSISEGIVTITYDGVITDVNYLAKKILKKSYKDMIGKNINEIISKSILKNIKKEMTNTEEKEIQIVSNGRKKTIRISFKPIYSHDNSIEEYLITFRESKNVYSQVNKLFGANAIYTFDDILGTSKEIYESIRLAKLIAATDATILLHGESGTGKEMFAQGIHNESPRKYNS